MDAGSIPAASTNLTCNNGESVTAFLERGVEACRTIAQGAIVVGDDDALPWTQQVLYSSQRRAA